MKIHILFIFLVIFSSSCSENRIKDLDFCESALCEEYFIIWKNLLMERNGFDEAYFNNHIEPFETSINSWNSGESFSVRYRITIDWMSCDVSDSFIIKIESDHYPHLNISREAYLEQNEINQVLSNYAFNSSMNVISPIEELKFRSKNDAMNELRENVNNNSMKFSEYMYKYAKPFFTPNGHPYIVGSGEIDRDNNECIKGELDLYTGEWEVKERPCVIYGLYIQY